MSAPSIKSMFDVGTDVLSSRVVTKNGSILVNLGDNTNVRGDSDGAQWWQHVGFKSRPAKPTVGKNGAQAIIFRQGDYDVAFASRDVRGLTTIPEIDFGESGVYATSADGETGRGYFVLRNDGSVEMVSSIPSLSFTVAADGSLTLSTTYGSLTFGPSGVVLEHPSGAKVELTAVVSRLFAPQVEIGPAVTAANTALWGPTGVAGAASATVKISP